MAGEIPQWMPFMSHGTVSTWWYSVQSSMLQNVLLFTGCVPTSANFFYVYHLGILVEELFFLVGLRLLAGKYITSPLALFLILVTASGSLITVDQPWYNLRLYSSLPMILYFVHQFIDTQQNRYLLLAINLLFFQMLGNLPYFLPIITFFVSLYFVCYFLKSPASLPAVLRGLARPKTIVSAALCFAASAVPVYLAVKLGTEEIVNYNPGRDVDVRVSEQVFITYGGQVSFKKWLELILGFSPHLDYSLYVGIVCLPLAIAALLAAPTKTVSLTGPIVVLVLLSAGRFPAQWVYYWPMMGYFRHIGLIGALVRVLLILLAGCGVQALLSSRQTVAIVVGTLILLCIAVVLLAMDVDDQYRHDAVWDTVSNYRPGAFLDLLDDDGAISERLAFTSLWAVLALVLFVVLVFAKLRWRTSLLAALLAVQILDIGTYKFSMLDAKTVPLPAAAYDALFFTEMSFPVRRYHPPKFSGEDKVSQQRDVVLQKVFKQHPRSPAIADLDESYGANYWSHDSFLFFDEIGSVYRIDHWLLPLDEYMRAYSGPGAHPQQAPPGFAAFYGLYFPDTHPAIRKISGCDPGKIQFFSRAYHAQTKTQVAARIGDPGYAGDAPILLLPAEADPDLLGSLESWDKKESPSSNFRLEPKYQVTRFDANHLQVVVENPGKQPIWLLYSDVTHPWWRARVNGKEQTIYIANLAYKAVPLDPGHNEVHFRCHSSLMEFLYTLFGLSALFWIGVLGVLTLQCLVGEAQARTVLCAPYKWYRSVVKRGATQSAGAG
jgi:hypothetical protein